MVVAPFGIVISVMALQPAKADSPMLFKPLGNTRLVNFVRRQRLGMDVRLGM